LFSVLVLMAVLTTVMTAPLLRWIGSPAPASAVRPADLEPASADR
jgi:hypothetical protein